MSDEFKQRAYDLLEAPLVKGSSQWQANRLALRQQMVAEDWGEFLRWSTIRAALYTGLTSETKARYDRLKSETNWDFWGKFLQDPGVGSPDLENDLGGCSGTFINQGYYLWRWSQLTGGNVRDMPLIVEVGGGYGAMSVICRRMGYVSPEPYVIYDFPELHLLQAYYLGQLNLDFVPLSTWKNFPVKVGLLMGIFSVSEMPLEERLFLNDVSPQHFLFVFQEQFGEFDNLSYFSYLSELRIEYEWAQIRCSDKYNHWLQVGVRRD